MIMITTFLFVSVPTVIVTLGLPDGNIFVRLPMDPKESLRILTEKTSLPNVKHWKVCCDGKESSYVLRPNDEDTMTIVSGWAATCSLSLVPELQLSADSDQTLSNQLGALEIYLLFQVLLILIVF